jgi:hypothetical protein
MSAFSVLHRLVLQCFLFGLSLDFFRSFSMRYNALIIGFLCVYVCVVCRVFYSQITPAITGLGVHFYSLLYSNGATFLLQLINLPGMVFTRSRPAY